MTTISRNQRVLMKVAQRKLKIPDAAYRAALVEIAGVTSSNELDQEGFAAMMGWFQWLGFEPGSPRGQDYGQRPGMASFAQLELIRALWAEFTGHVYSGDDELGKWLLRTFKVSSLRFLTKADAQKAITALKHMKARAA
ncbi:regulatory protein GemA [Rhodovulum marinum]|uniref:Uncharacterized protein DUF1018 n=1 Tax=Rhodovulum marinum TaxID=320662 RepID=A0A4R2Q446_9RHOB|nr:regulatory protein GemA [Rhodovulum marinum]TCP43360.1 uncharacterized protein DUF1018 [Rhodovulum marinum]